MSVLWEIGLSMFVMLHIVMGEFTQRTNTNGRCHELEIKVAEHTAKMSYLEYENSKQEITINELMNKVALLDFKMAKREEIQTGFDKSLQKLQNDLIDGWSNLTESLGKNLNGRDDDIKIHLMSIINSALERDENKTDQITALRQSVENLTEIVTKTACNNPGKLQFQNISTSLNKKADEIKSEIISVMQKTSDHQIDKMAKIQQTLDHMTWEANKTAITHPDCKTLYDNGIRQNGVYTITPYPSNSFDVYCDMDDGGWTVIQNRFDGSTNFTRGWSDYRNGFGSLNGEYWLGLDKIYLLTNPLHRMLKLDTITYDSRNLHALYESFRIADERSSFTLLLGSYINGTINRKSFDYHNNRMFTTFDHNGGNSCPISRKGGWWFKNCAFLYLNGLHGVKSDGVGIYEINGDYTYFRASRMKIQ